MDIDAEAAQLLRKIGWDDSDWAQIELYANMSPDRKVEQMFRIRREHVGLLEQRLRIEHPGSSDLEIRQMVLEHLGLVRESR